MDADRLKRLRESLKDDSYMEKAVESIGEQFSQDFEDAFPGAKFSDITPDRKVLNQDDVQRRMLILSEEEIEHGLHAYMNRGCRCDECRKAVKDYKRKQYVKKTCS